MKPLSLSILVLSALVALCMTSCGEKTSAADDSIKLWHTFNREESAALRKWLKKSGRSDVIPTILPFAMANIRVRSALADDSCPDLVRMDATRVPGLASEGLILKTPDKVWESRRWLPEARDLVWHGEHPYGVPQSLDGLALIHKRDIAPPSFGSLEDLENFLTASRTQVGMLIDGYWLLPFLRAHGADFPDRHGEPSIASENAMAGAKRFASFFAKGLAFDVLDERNATRAMVRAFLEGRLAFVMSGPWDLGALANGAPSDLDVTAFPGAHAPRGGQVLVVPTCAKHPRRAWELALAISAPKLQAEWAQALGAIPVTAEALAQAGPLANAFYRALEGTRPLPRHTRTPELFDDLLPAISAVVTGDATAEEALAGVARGWKRLYAMTPEDSP